MANTIDLFKSARLKEEDIVGENNFFRTNEEIAEYNKKQQKFLSNVDYSNPENFARFGSAEEYYKNAISYINSYYPYDSSRTEKYKWKNDLNEFEYYLYLKEYPKYAGYLHLTSSQALKVYAPTIALDNDAKTTFNEISNYFITSSLNVNNGFCFQSWLKFEDAVNNCKILTINQVVSASSLSKEELLNIYAESNNFKISSSTGIQTLNYTILEDVWKHYSFNIKDNEIQLYVNGDLTEEIKTLDLFSINYDLKFTKIGLLTSSLFYILDNSGSYTIEPTFQIGGNNFLYVDESRFWNEYKTVEGIGRNWFTSIDGNDINDKDNFNLIFYYKFNEGVSTNEDICLDYSGFKYYGLISNYNSFTVRISGSAINESGIVQDIETGDPILETSLQNTGILKNFYDDKILSGSTHDETNIHQLYKKFPSWILLEESEQEVQHLKQVIQIVSSYFDDIYNKITEVSKYKHLQYSQEQEKIYPFYDKILSSTGFEVNELFTNLDIIEKIASRTEKNVFDQDVEKVKNYLFQNIYNNLTYILKSKGTEKSLKSLLRSYGLNEDLVRINLYADKSLFNSNTKYREAIVKKKTVGLTDSANIYLSASSLSTNSKYFTLENSIYFDKKEKNNTPSSNSIFGFYAYNGANEFDWSNKTFDCYVTLETDGNSGSFYFRTGSSGDLIGSSSYIKDIFDNSVWNLSVRLQPDIDTLEGATTYDYLLDFHAVNINSYLTSSFTITSSMPLAIYNNIANNYIGYYVGARKNNLTGSASIETNIRVLNTNFWDDYLSDEIIIEHNKDITNYGVDQ
jgi:hypothetical protein